MNTYVRLFLYLAALSAATANAQVVTAVAGDGQQGYNGDGGPHGCVAIDAHRSSLG